MSTFIAIYGLGDISRDSMEVLFNSRITGGSEKDIYEICDSLLGYGIGNDKGELSWGVAISLKSMLRLYETTGEMRYLDSAAVSIKKIDNLRDDRREVCSYIDTLGHSITEPVWRNLKYSKYITSDSETIRRYDSYGDTINAEYADSCFASVYISLTALLIDIKAEFGIILDRDGLWGRYGMNRESFIDTIELSIAPHDNEWVTVGDYGVYIWEENVNPDLIWRSPTSISGETVAMNHLLLMGRALLNVYELTGTDEYKAKAELIARAFKRKLELNAEDAYLWKCRYVYNPNERPDDITHGA
jgi:hypothetical protein